MLRYIHFWELLRKSCKPTLNPHPQKIPMTLIYSIWIWLSFTSYACFSINENIYFRFYTGICSTFVSVSSSDYEIKKYIFPLLRGDIKSNSIDFGLEKEEASPLIGKPRSPKMFPLRCNWLNILTGTTCLLSLGYIIYTLFYPKDCIELEKERWVEWYFHISRFKPTLTITEF